MDDPEILGAARERVGEFSFTVVAQCEGVFVAVTPEVSGVAGHGTSRAEAIARAEEIAVFEIARRIAAGEGQPGGHDETLNVRVSESQKAGLQAIAASRNSSVSAVLRGMIDRLLDDFRGRGTNAPA